LGVENTGGALPSGFKLFNNFPNPFNPSTMIMFNIPIGVEVRLTVYNLLGAEIATIYNDYVQPGQYQAIWNGRDMKGNLVPSGTYLFELNSGSYFRQVKKMTLLK
jgi:flagellar hook assembly protein FlgD